MPLPKLRRTPDDPWLPTRLRHAADLARAELALTDALSAALACTLAWLREATTGQPVNPDFAVWENQTAAVLVTPDATQAKGIWSQAVDVFVRAVYAGPDDVWPAEQARIEASILPGVLAALDGVVRAGQEAGDGRDQLTARASAVLYLAGEPRSSAGADVLTAAVEPPQWATATAAAWQAWTRWAELDDLAAVARGHLRVAESLTARAAELAASGDQVNADRSAALAEKRRAQAAKVNPAPRRLAAARAVVDKLAGELPTPTAAPGRPMTSEAAPGKRAFYTRTQRAARAAAVAGYNARSLDNERKAAELFGEARVKVWLCVTPDTPIVAFNVSAVARRRYIGSVVDVATASGATVTLTPEHPVLTWQGWLPARLLDKGDDLFRVVGIDPARAPYVDEPPPSIGQIVDAAMEAEVIEVWPVTVGMNLDGDDSDGEVEVVRADGKLADRFHPGRDKGVADLAFVTADGLAKAVLLSGGATGEQVSVELAAGIGGGIRRASALVGVGASPHAIQASGRAVAERDAATLQCAPDRVTARPILAAQGGDARPGQIVADKIVAVEVKTWRGHVYDLSTAGGFYVADGLVIHNSTADRRTREDHVAADDQAVLLDEPFIVCGEQLMYPGDPAGSAACTANCRCTQTYDDVSETITLTAATDKETAMPWHKVEGHADCPSDKPWAVVADDTEELMGCHASEADADEQLAALYASEPAEDTEAAVEDQPVGDKPLPGYWFGVLAPLNTLSGDGREFVLDDGAEPRTRQLPLPFSWQEVSADGHDNSVVVGRIDDAWRDGDSLMGWGTFDLGSDEGREAARQLAEGFAARVSVDADDVLAEIVPADDSDLLGAENLLYVSWRLAGATMVSISAFDEAQIEPRWDQPARASEPLVAAVVGATDLPVADRDMAWDGQAAQTRVFDLYTSDSGEVDAASVARAFIWRDDAADPQTREAYRGGFADVVNGQLQIVPKGVAALAGAHGVDAIKGPTGEDVGRLHSRVCSLYDTIRSKFDDWPECPFAEAADETALVAAASWQPPREWFDNPGLDRYTPNLVVGEDGRVFGHIGQWGACYRGRPGCTQMPRTRSGYAGFHTRLLSTADGGRVAAGHLTYGGGHADLSMDAASARRHYDDASTAVIACRVGEDEHGIWLAGAVMPGVDRAVEARLDGHPVSGDWRSGELIGVHAVNTPGFDPRPQAYLDSLAASMEPVALVAAGRSAGEPVALPIVDEALVAAVIEAMDRRTARARRVADLTRRVGLDPAARAARIAARIGRR